MSTFSGRIRECPWISIDHFCGINLRSTIFFLSHCHQDHMTGLADDAFYELLVTNNYKLYCHNVTKVLLESCSKYSRLTAHIEGKKFNEPFVVTSPKENREADSPGTDLSVSVKVTFLDAQHCPGSVMILLEFQDNNTVLYTGDFRLSRDDWYSCAPLRDPFSSTGFKHISSLYFDSTFCRKGTINMPSKEQSKQLFLKMVSEWLDMHPSHKVLIWGTCYGQEFLLRAVWEKLGLQCHVSSDKYRIYSKLADFADCVTCFAHSTRVHACTTGLSAMDECYEERNQVMVKSKNRKYKPQIFPCGLCRPDNKMVRVIRPSVIWFARRNEKNAVGYDHRFFCRLFYSNHCSFAEIVDSFKVLRPTCAFPNVIDKKIGLQHIEKIMKYLNRYLHDSAELEDLKGPEQASKHPIKSEVAEEQEERKMKLVLSGVHEFKSSSLNFSQEVIVLSDDEQP